MSKIAKGDNDDPKRKWDIGKINAIKDNIKKNDKIKERTKETELCDKLVNEMKNPTMDKERKWQTDEINDITKNIKTPPKPKPDGWELKELEAIISQIQKEDKEKERDWELGELEKIKENLINKDPYPSDTEWQDPWNVPNESANGLGIDTKNVTMNSQKDGLNKTNFSSISKNKRKDDDDFEKVDTNNKN